MQASSDANYLLSTTNPVHMPVSAIDDQEEDARGFQPYQDF
jgi:hypothetical protein